MKTLSVGKSVSLINDYLYVPIVLSVDVDMLWCQILTKVDKNMTEKWRLLNELGNWTEFFPVENSLVYSEKQFDLVWSGMSYTNISDYITSRKNDLTNRDRILNMVMLGRNYGNFIYIDISRSLTDKMLSREVCSYGQLIGNSILRHDWMNLYNALLKQFDVGKMSYEIIPKDTMRKLVEMVPGIYSSIYKDEPQLLYKEADLDVNLQEVTQSIIRGYIRIPLLKAFDDMKFDVFEINGIIYYSDTYVSHGVVDIPSCTHLGSRLICDTQENKLKRFVRLDRPIMSMNGVILINSEVLCQINDFNDGSVKVEGPLMMLSNNVSSITYGNEVMSIGYRYESNWIDSRNVKISDLNVMSMYDLEEISMLTYVNFVMMVCIHFMIFCTYSYICIRNNSNRYCVNHNLNMNKSTSVSMQNLKIVKSVIDDIHLKDEATQVDILTSKSHESRVTKKSSVLNGLKD